MAGRPGPPPTGYLAAPVGIEGSDLRLRTVPGPSGTALGPWSEQPGWACGPQVESQGRYLEGGTVQVRDLPPAPRAEVAQVVEAAAGQYQDIALGSTPSPAPGSTSRRPGGQLSVRIRPWALLPSRPTRGRGRGAHPSGTPAQVRSKAERDHINLIDGFKCCRAAHRMAAIATIECRKHTIARWRMDTPPPGATAPGSSLV